MNSMYCCLDRYVYICMLHVYVYDIGMYVSICYVECMLFLCAILCSRLVLHHVGGSGFHKTKLGIVKTCFKQEKQAHDRG